MRYRFPLRSREAARGTSIESLVERVAVVLESSGLTLATAESCTGGLISAALTSRPGSSDWYIGGVVTYSNESKRELLGVDADSLRRFGAVSRTVATEMARGARERVGADLAVSVTGIAGPSGAVPGKPVGTVWIGIAAPAGSGATQLTFSGDRAAIRSAAVRAALLAVIAWAGAAPALGAQRSQGQP